MVIPKNIWWLPVWFAPSYSSCSSAWSRFSISESIVVNIKDESEQIAEVVQKYPDIQFSIIRARKNSSWPASSDPCWKQELMYQLMACHSLAISKIPLSSTNMFGKTSMHSWYPTRLARDLPHIAIPGKFVVAVFADAGTGTSAFDYLNMNSLSWSAG